MNITHGYPSVRVLIGDCREMLQTLPKESVRCCVTSPPYFGLRDYTHPDQLGQESSPEAYVQNLVQVFREVRRVLTNDGTLWLNLGDSYCSQGVSHDERTDNQPRVGASRIWRNGTGRADGVTDSRGQRNRNGVKVNNLRPKNLIGIPWRTALALQADGWILRQDIIWAKPNPMPESVTDRFTKSHEYLFLLTKSGRYYFDQQAILEPAAESTHQRLAQDVESQKGSTRVPGKTNGTMKAVGRGGRTAFRGQGHERQGLGPANRTGRNMRDVGASTMRNKRSVWTVPTVPYSGSHFATFPPDLIKPCILAGTSVQETVLDPFAGSGTVGQVALELCRNSILIELNPDYERLIQDRIRITPGLQI